MRTIFTLLLLTLFLGASASAQDIDKLPTIAAVGTVEVEAVPDEVNISLEVEKIDKDLQIAKRLNDESVGKILELTRRFDVKPQNVKTAFISVEMKYETVRDPKKKVYDAGGDEIGIRVFKGYEVSKTVVIKLTDVSRFEQFFEEVLKTGITEVNNVSFETSKYRELKVEARELAIKAAQKKAMAMAAAVNQTIGKAIYIGEGEGIVSVSNRGRSNNFVIEGQDNNDNVPSANSSGLTATFAPGAIRVKSSVTIVFVLN
ncbi:MAG: SIMPL domain-containing protein [Pyrinomonadaceae bacterium]|nr:SIMPL domain-containing protein [Pyrinomonadaceae bacterium]